MQHWDDIGRVDVCLLQPATLTRNGLDVGQTLEVSFDENGLAGPATVLAIEPCPPDLTLADGTILAAFQRYVSGPVVELTVGEPNGTFETSIGSRGLSELTRLARVRRVSVFQMAHRFAPNSRVDDGSGFADAIGIAPQASRQSSNFMQKQKGGKFKRHEVRDHT